MTAPEQPCGNEELLHAFRRDGDEDALNELFERHHFSAYKTALKALGDPATADDVAGEALRKVALNAHRFRTGAPFGPWFRTILWNAIRSRARRRKARRNREQRAAIRVDEAVRAMEPADENDAQAKLRRVEEHLQRLPLKQRSALVLRFFEGLSFKEVAETLGCPLRTAQSRVRLGLESLRRGLATAGVVLVMSLEEALAQDPTQASVAPPAPSLAELLGPEAIKSCAATGSLQGGWLKVAMFMVMAGAILLAWWQSSSREHTSPGTRAVSNRGPAGESVDGAARSERDSDSVSRADHPSDRSVADRPERPRFGASQSEMEEAGVEVVVRARDRQGRPVKDAIVLADESLAASTGTPVAPIGFPLATLDDREYPEGHWGVVESTLKGPTVGEREFLWASAATTTQDSGEARLHLPEGIYYIYLRKGLAIGAGAPVVVRKGELVEVEVILSVPEEPAAGRGTLFGEIAGPDGPVRHAGLPFEVYRKDLGQYIAGPWALTDGEGRYVLPNVEPGHLRLRLHRRPERPYHSPTVHVETDRAQRLDILLEAGASLRGRVLDAQGKPLAGAQVFASNPAVPGKDLDDVVTDQEGRYALEGLPPGEVDLLVVDNRGIHTVARLEAVPVSLFDQRGPTVRLCRKATGGQLDGRVLDASGQPLQEIMVTLSGHDGCWTDKAGRFEMRQITPGRYWLVAAPSAWNGPPLVSRLVEVAEGRQSITVQLPVDPDALRPARLRGRVLDGKERPLPGASVGAWVGSGTSNNLWTETNEEGAFELELPGGEVLVMALPSPAPAQLDLGSIRLPLTLVAGEDREVIFRLRPAGSISGRLVGPADQVAGLMVTVAPESDEPEGDPVAVALAGSDGRFTLSRVPAGRHRLLVSQRENHASSHLLARELLLEVAPGQEISGLTVPLLPLVELKMRFEGFQEGAREIRVRRADDDDLPFLSEQTNLLARQLLRVDPSAESSLLLAARGERIRLEAVVSSGRMRWLLLGPEVTVAADEREKELNWHHEPPRSGSGELLLIGLPDPERPSDIAVVLHGYGRVGVAEVGQPVRLLRLDDLPAGRYQVQLRSWTGRFEPTEGLPVDVLPGQRTRLDLGHGRD